MITGFTSKAEDSSSIPGQVITKTLKWHVQLLFLTLNIKEKCEDQTCYSVVSQGEALSGNFPV